MKKALVAGGAGFIGVHLCKRLLEEGYEVFCVDNFYSSSRRNVQHLIRAYGATRFHLIEADITQSLQLRTNFDEIYNLACPASPVHYQSNRVFTLKTNVMGTSNLLDLAREHGAAFLQASTSEVYGDPLEHPQTESYWGNVNPNGIRSCYDEGKRCAETLCLDFADQFSINCSIIRIFNTYGPFMDPNDGRVVSNFIMQALKGELITIYGDGSQTRSFQYVSDLVDGIRLTMQKKFVGPVNLGNPNEFTVKELAEMVKDRINPKAEIIYRPLPQDDPKRRKPDISLAQKHLGWIPKIQIAAGLDSTITYFQQNMNPNFEHT